MDNAEAFVIAANASMSMLAKRGRECMLSGLHQLGLTHQVVANRIQRRHQHDARHALAVRWQVLQEPLALQGQGAVDSGRALATARCNWVVEAG